jgi:hypothetical protein
MLTENKQGRQMEKNPTESTDILMHDNNVLIHEWGTKTM